MNETLLERLGLRRNVKLQIDKKVFLKSQYIAKRICELTNIPHEIGFIYGGTVTKNKTQKIIDIQDIQLPLKQYITPSHFQFKEGISKAHTYFKRNDRRIIGLGHSHAAFDVFHSQEDYTNLKPLCISEGIRVSYTQNKPNKQTTELTQQKLESKEQKTVSVFPSIVFNQKQEYHVGLAARSKTFTVHEKFPIVFYNKQAELSSLEKKHLDLQIMQILRYNNLPIKEEFIPQIQKYQPDYQI